MTLEVPWAEDEAISTQQVSTVARATIPRGPCGASDAKEWQWTLMAENGTLLTKLLTLREEQTVVTYEFLGHFLAPGARYFYGLVSTDATAVNVLMSKSRGFRADGPPSGGVTTVEPSEGFAVTTPFVLETSSWSDEEVLRLSLKT